MKLKITAFCGINYVIVFITFSECIFFSFLGVAKNFLKVVYLGFFQEAFKAVEDIHGLFALSKKPPKPQLMANYYHKVSTVFWKSGNALFHASTLHRLYHLSREMRKNLTQEEMQRWGMIFNVILDSFSKPVATKIH